LFTVRTKAITMVKNILFYLFKTTFILCQKKLVYFYFFVIASITCVVSVFADNLLGSCLKIRFMCPVINNSDTRFIILTMQNKFDSCFVL